MTRQEHLDWCKQRANEYGDAWDFDQAFASFQSDMRKHDETADHSALQLFAMAYFGGLIKTPEQMRHWIDGFN